MIIPRPVRRMMLAQGIAGTGIGACAAAGVPLTGNVGTGLNMAVLAPTTLIQMRPVIGNLSLPMRWFLPLTICSALLAIATASLFSTVGIMAGVLGWFVIAEPAVRTTVTSYLNLSIPVIAAGKWLWKAAR